MRPSASSRIDDLRGFGLRVLGLKDTLDTHVDSCHKLFDLAHFLRDNASRYEDPHDGDLLKKLNSLLDDIFEFEVQMSTGPLLRRVALAEHHKQKTVTYAGQLSDAWSRYQADRVSYLIELVQRVERGEQRKTSLNPVPVEELSPVLPPDLSTSYVGHGEELEKLVELLCSHPSPNAIILGGGGMGKTTMATKALYHGDVEAKFSNRRFFIECDGLITAEAVVAAVSAVFSVTESHGTTLQQSLLNYLRSLRTPVLIVLDNLESAWDTDDQTAVETLLAHVCRVSLIAVLVTMRGASPLHGPLWHQKLILQPLALGEAYSMFTELCPTIDGADDERCLRHLLRLLDGVPLAITLLASVGQTGYSASELLDAYREERTAMVKRGRAKDRLSNLDVSIKVSISCQTMKENPQALKLLTLLSLLPDGLEDKHRVAALPSMTEYSSAARALVQVGLCIRNDGTCRVLSPIRSYVEVHHPPSERHLDELRYYHFQVAFRAWGFNKAPVAVRNDLEPKMANIQAVLAHAIGNTTDVKELLASVVALAHFSRMASVGDCRPYLEAVISTYENSSEKGLGDLMANCRLELGDLLMMRHDGKGALRALWQANAAYEEMTDQLGSAYCKRSLGYALRMMDDYDGSGTVLREARALFGDLGDLYGVAECMRGLGEVMHLQSAYDNASAALKEAKALYEDLEDRPGIAQCLEDLGDILLSKGDYEGATTALMEAKAVCEDNGNRLGAAHCLQSLGSVMLMRDDYEGATAALTEAKGAFDDIGDIFSAAQCLQSLGDVMLTQDALEGATEALTRAKTRFETLGNRFGSAHCMSSLADIKRLRSDYDGARTDLEEAKQNFETIGNPLGVAQCMQRQSELMRFQKDYEGATAVLRNAKAIFDDLGERMGAAQCTQSLADVMRMQENYDGATEALKEATAVFENIGDRLGVAHCMQSLGDVKRMQDDYEGASAALHDAKAVFEDIGNPLGTAQCLQSLGSAMLIPDNYEGAISALTEAKERMHDLEHHLGVAQCIQLLADVMFLQGDYEGATTAANDARNKFEEIGDGFGVSECDEFLDEIVQKRDADKNATFPRKVVSIRD